MILNHTTNNPIKDAESLSTDAKKYFKNMKVFFVSEKQIEEICNKMDIDNRLQIATTIKGTQRLHAFSSIPQDQKHLSVKPVSVLPDSEAKIVRIS